MKKKNKAQHRPPARQGPGAHPREGRGRRVRPRENHARSMEPEPPGLTAAAPGAGASGTAGLVLGLTASPLDLQDSRKRGSCPFCPQGPGGREQQQLGDSANTGAHGSLGTQRPRG